MNQEIGRSVLRYGLWLAIAYQLYASVASTFTLGLELTTILNFVFLFSFFTLLRLLTRSADFQPIALTYQILCMIGFTYFWLNFGGMKGSVPYFLCVFIASVIIINRGVYLVAALLLYFGIFGSLIFLPEYFTVTEFDDIPAGRITRDLDYIIIMIILIAFFIYLKSQFLHYKAQVIRRHHELQKLASTVYDQNQKLEQQQREIRMINDNLEQIISEHTREIEHKHEELSEYAFINAHMLRAPLCRVVGLANLIEMENRNHARDMKTIREISAEIDSIICKINDSVT